MCIWKNVSIEEQNNLVARLYYFISETSRQVCGLKGNCVEKQQALQQAVLISKNSLMASLAHLIF